MLHNDMVCCLCIENNGELSHCGVSCKFDPKGYTGPTSPVKYGDYCYYSDLNKYFCGQYNYIYSCGYDRWDPVGYACTDGCEDNGGHNNLNDTCKNKKKEELI